MVGPSMYTSTIVFLQKLTLSLYFLYMSSLFRSRLHIGSDIIRYSTKNFYFWTRAAFLRRGKFIFFYDHNHGTVDDSISGRAQGTQGSFGLERLMLCVCSFHH